MIEAPNNTAFEEDLAGMMSAKIKEVKRHRRATNIRGTLKALVELRVMVGEAPKGMCGPLKKWMVGNGLDLAEIRRAGSIRDDQPTTANLRNAGLVISASGTARQKRKRTVEKSWVYYLGKLKIAMGKARWSEMDETQRKTVRAHFARFDRWVG